MTINPETEIVATRYDPKTRDCFYTIQRGDRRWTAKVPLADLDKLAGNKQKRRNHLATVLELAMRGEPDAVA